MMGLYHENLREIMKIYTIGGNKHFGEVAKFIFVYFDYNLAVYI